MEETPEYLKGQAAALKLLNRVLFDLLVTDPQKTGDQHLLRNQALIDEPPQRQRTCCCGIVHGPLVDEGLQPQLLSDFARGDDVLANYGHDFVENLRAQGAARQQAADQRKQDVIEQFHLLSLP